MGRTTGMVSAPKTNSSSEAIMDPITGVWPLTPKSGVWPIATAPAMDLGAGWVRVRESGVLLWDGVGWGWGGLDWVEVEIGGGKSLSGITDWTEPAWNEVSCGVFPVVVVVLWVDWDLERWLVVEVVEESEWVDWDLIMPEDVDNDDWSWVCCCGGCSCWRGRKSPSICKSVTIPKSVLVPVPSVSTKSK